MIEGPSERLTEREWEAMELGAICFTPPEWAKVKIFIRDVCEKGYCNDNWERVEAFLKQLEMKDADSI